MIYEVILATDDAAIAGIASWFLASIFLISGVAKLRRPALAAMAIVDFGVLKRARPHFGWALGLAEVGLAIALAASTGFGVYWIPGMVSAALLIAFAFLIARSLMAGDRFSCFCFGDSESPLSTWTLARTMALALLATMLGFRWLPGDTGPHSGFDLLVVAIAAWALLGVVLLSRAIPQLLAWNGELYGRGMVR